MEQPIVEKASSDQTALSLPVQSGLPVHVSGQGIVTRASGFVIFLMTVLLSVGVIVFLALATPIVILLAAIADLLDKESVGTGWTQEKITQNAG